MRKNSGKTTKHAASAPFNVASILAADDLPGYLAESLADGDYRALPMALRAASEVLGMTDLAQRTGLSRETLYRTLSPKGNPRLETLGAILGAFGLQLAVAPMKKPQRRARPAASAARV